MKNSRINPIAQQSKEWIKDSLFHLMENNEYSKITISEIADTAQLHRRTFYRNFKTKDDVISFYLETLCQNYIELLKEEENLSLPNITRVFFSFWSNHLDFLLLLEKNNLLHFLLEKLNESLPTIYRVLKNEKNEYSYDEDLRYVLAYSVGGYWNTLKLWLKEGASRDPVELSEIFEKAMRINFAYISD